MDNALQPPGGAGDTRRDARATAQTAARGLPGRPLTAQQTGIGTAARYDMKRCRRLIDGLAIATRAPRGHAGPTFARVGSFLVSVTSTATCRYSRERPSDPTRSTTGTADTLARWPLACECGNSRDRCRCLLRRQLILRCRGFEILQLQLELVERPDAALGALTRTFALVLGDGNLSAGGTFHWSAQVFMRWRRISKADRVE